MHDVLTSYFETILATHNPSLFYDIIANTGLAHFIMREVTQYFSTSPISSRYSSRYSSGKCIEEPTNNTKKQPNFACREKAGYYGFLIRIAHGIQQIFEMKSNLFFRLYTCNDEQCKQQFQHPLTRDGWNQFYNEYIANHLDMCFVDVGSLFLTLMGSFILMMNKFVFCLLLYCVVCCRMIVCLNTIRTHV